MEQTKHENKLHATGIGREVMISSVTRRVYDHNSFHRLKVSCVVGRVWGQGHFFYSKIICVEPYIKL